MVGDEEKRKRGEEAAAYVKQVSMSASAQRDRRQRQEIVDGPCRRPYSTLGTTLHHIQQDEFRSTLVADASTLDGAPTGCPISLMSVFSCLSGLVSNNYDLICTS